MSTMLLACAIGVFRQQCKPAAGLHHHRLLQWPPRPVEHTAKSPPRPWCTGPIRVAGPFHRVTRHGPDVSNVSSLPLLHVLAPLPL